ncbi:integrase catalytic domain-containing protein [Trichonephila clavata]|uniref:Integrase catalytic domain-containing protein n=1 Tax=Trichonephila clavata TaxID=2740835 RepID=A0A8X6G8W7_TRICU|nr:integrase catalytic domain-containing protein [Trichonephila clavata]
MPFRFFYNSSGFGIIADAANQALLEREKRARSVSRSLVTKQINKLENEINNSADKTTVHEIYVQLISKYEELSTLDKEVESLINIESLEDEILTREEYRDKFIIWKIRAERYIGTVSSITFQNSVENQPQNVTPLNNTKGKVDVKPTSSNSVLHNRGGVLLQCVKAEVIGHISSDKIFCLFDNGSEKSFIKKNVSRRLGLKKVGSERLNIFSFGCKTPKKQTCIKVEVRLRYLLNGEVTVIEALEIEEISKATLSLPSPDVWTELETKGFRLTFNCSESSENCEISLLIGSDFYWFLTHWIKRLDSSLVVVETSLGWSLQGKCDEQSDCTSVHLIHSEEESISAELRRFWEIESLGIRDNDSVSLGNGDEEILSEFDKSVCFVDGRYRVSLPWKPGMREVLQNNKTVARKRFEGLVRRFKCDHELFCEYKDVIDNYVREGILERTSCESLSDSQGFYLPHHAVIRSDKTTSVFALCLMVRLTKTDIHR